MLTKYAVEDWKYSWRQLYTLSFLYLVEALNGGYFASVFIINGRSWATRFSELDDHDWGNSDFPFVVTKTVRDPSPVVLVELFYIHGAWQSLPQDAGVESILQRGWGHLVVWSGQKEAERWPCCSLQLPEEMKWGGRCWSLLPGDAWSLLNGRTHGSSTELCRGMVRLDTRNN